MYTRKIVLKCIENGKDGTQNRDNKPEEQRVTLII